MSEATATARPEAVLLADYEPPAWAILQVELAFLLEPSATRVRSRLELERRRPDEPVRLLGRDLELVGATLDGRPLDPAGFTLTAGDLTIPVAGASAVLEIETLIRPDANTSLMGLYVSNGIFCTQCEAEGFRRITFYPDRPDVMAPFKVRIEADKARYPVLLSNGNPVGAGDLDGGRHFALWEDPFPKPCYLFALVAGDLARIDDSFTTRSGREVALRLYAEAAAIDQCHWAMDSLKRSMRWDEDAYGLEYDLDLFMIVGVGDFNFGAMENKGLNIFNTSALLARPDTSTDADFQSVERIVAHEYFHNWTGDRVTCRDWFQLTLKEGLTVFRDQQFAADMHSAAVKRISDVVLLRETQFAEDAGPLAHPIRPASYVEINNFYTRTVYEKGAEVIRMIHTLIGAEAFRKGIDLYFERYDGEAVTCEDFVAAMADASGRDMGPFMRWYEQAGTPELKVERSFDPATGRLTLDVTQTTPPTPGQPDKLPVVIPLRLGLVGADGAALPVQLEGENEPGGVERVLEVTEAAQRFTLIGLDQAPVPSLLRGFSAPVRLDAGYSEAELAHLLAHDEDPFCRWEAGQTLAAQLLLAQIREASHGRPIVVADALVDAFEAVLARAHEDPAFAARALALPGRSYIAQAMPQILVDPMAAAFRAFQSALGSRLQERWTAIYHAMHRPGDATVDTAAFGRRALKATALTYLIQGEVDGAASLAVLQHEEAGNMTDRLGALRALAERPGAELDRLLAAFFEAWRHEPLVVNKWFALQAGIEDDRAPERVARLLDHPAFTMSNPNRVRAVLGTYAIGNLEGFHRKDGAGYRLVTDKVILLDRLNASVAARLLTSLGRWRRYDEQRQGLMRAELERVLATPGLSRDSFEIASKSLG